MFRGSAYSYPLFCPRNKDGESQYRCPIRAIPNLDQFESDAFIVPSVAAVVNNATSVSEWLVSAVLIPNDISHGTERLGREVGQTRIDINLFCE